MNRECTDIQIGTDFVSEKGQRPVPALAMVYERRKGEGEG